MINKILKAIIKWSQKTYMGRIAPYVDYEAFTPAQLDAYFEDEEVDEETLRKIRALS